MSFPNFGRFTTKGASAVWNLADVAAGPVGEGV